MVILTSKQKICGYDGCQMPIDELETMCKYHLRLDKIMTEFYATLGKYVYEKRMNERRENGELL